MRVYRDVLIVAWRGLWHHPWLLFFGFFAALAGSTGEYGSIVTSYNKLQDELGLIDGLKQAIYNSDIFEIGAQFWALLNQPAYTVILISSLLLAVLLGFLIVTIAQVGLIESAGRIAEGNAPTFKESFVSGIKNFLPILWLNIILKFAIYLLLVVGSMPFLIYYLSQPQAGGSFYWLGVISFIIFIPLAIVVNFIVKYAMAYIVLKGYSWWQGLERGINLFLRNWLVSLEMAGILFVIFITLGMFLQFFLTTNFAARLVILVIDFRFAALIELLPTLAIIIFVGAAYGAYQYLAWIFLFEKLDKEQAVSKIERLTQDVPEYIDKWMGSPPKVKSK